MRTDVDGGIICCKPNLIRRRKTMKNATLLTITGLLAIGLMFGGNLAHAQNIGGHPGTLDAKFGTGGTVTTIFSGAGSPVMLPIGAAQQASGDIVVLSEFDFVADEGTQIGLTRYTAAGRLDTTFGTQGSTITNFSSFTFQPYAFALEPNGKILVAGTVSGSDTFGLAQFTANGVLDTTFGTDGVAAVFAGGADFPSAFLLQPNGQILMGGFQDGGRHSPGSLSLVRFNSNGALDPTFGTDGVSLVTPAPILSPQALALLSNGDYLAVGESGGGGRHSGGAQLYRRAVIHGDCGNLDGEQPVGRARTLPDHFRVERRLSCGPASL
jgi:uncharacterized delta-60 repeat protein